MRVLVQRSLNSSVTVGGKIVGSIKSGIVAFVGFTENDNESDIESFKSIEEFERLKKELVGD